MALERLTLRDMIYDPEIYSGLPDGLIQLPVPNVIRIRRKKYRVPQSVEEFNKSLCYGQRLFIARKEENDFGLILRVMDGYYYSLVTGDKWDEEKALLFGKYILTLQAIDLYPVAMQLITFVGEMIEQERTLLHREPSKLEVAAGIDRLNVFSELTSLDFLRDVMKITVPEVLLTPYNECLVRFMLAKETADFQEKYFDLLKTASEPKPKRK
jgi:hypothetical protein